MENDTHILKPVRPGTILLALAILLYVCLILWIGVIQDDAYIDFRYAEHFLSGDGLVFNPGERVEGYTNFLWLVLMILGRQIGLAYAIWAKILGSLCGAITLVVVYRISFILSDRYAARWRDALAGIGSLFLGATLSFAYWSGAGLETAAFTLAVAISVYACLKRSIFLAVTLVLATLLRPEGLLLFLLVVIHETVERKKFTSYLATIIAVYAVFLLPFVIFKLTYYGTLIPNTFHAKAALTAQKMLDGLQYGAQYVWQYLGAGLFIIPFLFFVRRFAGAGRLLVLIVAVFTAYIVFVGGDVLKVHRFFVPLMPLIVPMIILGVNEAVRRKGVFIAVMVFILLWRVSLPFAHVATFRAAERGFADKMDRLSRSLLAIDTTDFTAAASTIGRFSYNLNNHFVIDLLGLTDSTIAKHPEAPIKGLRSSWREAQYNCPYVLSRQPDYIVFSTGFKPSAPAERALFAYSAFLDSYRTIPLDLNGQLHYIYKRYYPISEPITRNVDIELANLYNQAANYVRKADSLDMAILYLDSALAFAPEPAYPYLYYYIAYSLTRMGQFQPAYTVLQKLVTEDTLVCQAYMDLYWYEHMAGNSEKVNEYRKHILELAPWIVPRLDSLINK